MFIYRISTAVFIIIDAKDKIVEANIFAKGTITFNI